MRTAIVFFNLGGPDRPEAVESFLFNLFDDPAIIRIPWPLRGWLARFIAKRRGPKARAIYAQIGGGSPLLPNTIAQIRAVESGLADLGAVRGFPAMRYWHPMSPEVAKDVQAWNPDRIILLPLYPQFSTTTTASSLAAWHDAARAQGLATRTTTLCCYPTQSGLIAAIAALTRQGVETAQSHGRPRILFSAHGLPEKIIAAGDPYQWQVERTAEAVMAKLQGLDADWVVCYQSRVGPLKWIGPSTEAEIARAGADRAPLVIVPIAFVSEHSETLVELDIDYAERAAHAGVPHYVRVATVSTHPEFIAGLVALVREALQRDDDAARPTGGTRICPANFVGCPCRGGT